MYARRGKKSKQEPKIVEVKEESKEEVKEIKTNLIIPNHKDEGDNLSYNQLEQIANLYFRKVGKINNITQDSIPNGVEVNNDLNITIFNRLKDYNESENSSGIKEPEVINVKNDDNEITEINIKNLNYSNTCMFLFKSKTDGDYKNNYFLVFVYPYLKDVNNTPTGYIAARFIIASSIDELLTTYFDDEYERINQLNDNITSGNYFYVNVTDNNASFNVYNDGLHTPQKRYVIDFNNDIFYCILDSKSPNWDKEPETVDKILNDYKAYCYYNSNEISNNLKEQVLNTRYLLCSDNNKKLFTDFVGNDTECNSQVLLTILDNIVLHVQVNKVPIGEDDYGNTIFDCHAGYKYGLNTFKVDYKEKTIQKEGEDIFEYYLTFPFYSGISNSLTNENFNFLTNGRTFNSEDILNEIQTLKLSDVLLSQMPATTTFSTSDLDPRYFLYASSNVIDNSDISYNNLSDGCYTCIISNYLIDKVGDYSKFKLFNNSTSYEVSQTRCPVFLVNDENDNVNYTVNYKGILILCKENGIFAYWSEGDKYKIKCLLNVNYNSEYNAYINDTNQCLVNISNDGLEVREDILSSFIYEIKNDNNTFYMPNINIISKDNGYYLITFPSFCIIDKPTLSMKSFSDNGCIPTTNDDYITDDMVIGGQHNQLSAGNINISLSRYNQSYLDMKKDCYTIATEDDCKNSNGKQIYKAPKLGFSFDYLKQSINNITKTIGFMLRIKMDNIDFNDENESFYENIEKRYSVIQIIKSNENYNFNFINPASGVTPTTLNLSKNDDSVVINNSITLDNCISFLNSDEEEDSIIIRNEKIGENDNVVIYISKQKDIEINSLACNSKVESDLPLCNKYNCELMAIYEDTSITDNEPVTQDDQPFFRIFIGNKSIRLNDTSDSINTAYTKFENSIKTYVNMNENNTIKLEDLYNNLTILSSIYLSVFICYRYEYQQTKDDKTYSNGLIHYYKCLLNYVPSSVIEDNIITNENERLIKSGKVEKIYLDDNNFKCSYTSSDKNNNDTAYFIKVTKDEGNTIISLNDIDLDTTNDITISNLKVNQIDGDDNDINDYAVYNGCNMNESFYNKYNNQSFIKSFLPIDYLNQNDIKLNEIEIVQVKFKCYLKSN